MTLLSADLEPLWIARYDYQPGWRLPLHSHDDYFQAILILHGEGSVLIADQRQPFKKGQLFFLPPGLVHGLETAARGIVRTLDTKFLIRKAALRNTCERLPPIFSVTPPRITVLFESIYGEARSHHAHSYDLCGVQLLEMLFLLLSVSDQPASGPGQTSVTKSLVSEKTKAPGDEPLCERIRAFICDHYAESLDQKQFSTALDYSYRHLHDTWHRRYEESPLQALMRYRVEQAMHLIRYSDYELKRIAPMTGFATVHHFTRIFSQLVGVSPGRWRAQERRNGAEHIVLRPGFINRSLTIRSAN